MFARAIGKVGGMQSDLSAGSPVLSQLSPVNNATAAGTTLTAQEILSGWIRRSNGGGAGYIDTWPTADSIIAAMTASGLGPSVGDCFQVIYQNLVAFLSTNALGTGIIAGTGTLNIAASTTRLFFLTLLATKPSVVLVGSTTNTNPNLRGFTAAQLAGVMPGMGVTGTGVGASAVVLGVVPGDGTADLVTGGYVVVSVNSTATASVIAMTFFPRIRLDAIGTLAA